MVALRLKGIDKFYGDSHVLRVIADFQNTSVASVGVKRQHFYLADKGRSSGKVLHYECLKTDTHLIVDRGEKAALTVRVFGQHEFDLDASIVVDSDDDNIVVLMAKSSVLN
jgi:hypothetical protein